MRTREVVLGEVVHIVQSLAEDWDFSGEIDASTRLFGDLNWQSVDMVVLAHELQTTYKQSFPFLEFFAELQGRSIPGVTVGELADFIFANLEQQAPTQSAAS